MLRGDDFGSMLGSVANYQGLHSYFSLNFLITLVSCSCFIPQHVTLTRILAIPQHALQLHAILPGEAMTASLGIWRL